MGISLQVTNRMVELLDHHFPNLQAVYLFGSGGSGDFGARSDIDLAVLLPVQHARSISSEIWLEARFRLEEATRRDVDLVNLRTASMVLRKEVIRTGRLLCCRDRRATDDFEMLTLSFYQKLNAERSSIVESVLASGRVLA